MTTVASDAAIAGLEWPLDDTRIPQQVFTDPALFELEQERLFRGETWHLVGHEAEIPAEGDYKTHELGGVPLVLARDREGRVNALVNACSHRGCQIVNERHGHVEGGVMRCMYHLWTFDLCGRCTGASLPESFPEDFSKDDYGLARVRCESINGLLFVTLGGRTPPLADYLGEIAGGLHDLLGARSWDYLGSHRGVFDCNWKLIAENSADGYHVVLLHGAYKLMKIKGSGEFRGSGPETYFHSWAIFRPEDIDPAILEDPTVLSSYTRHGEIGSVINVFPVSTISHQLDSLLLRYYVPLAPNRTEVVFAYFAPTGDDPDLRKHRIRQCSSLWGMQGLIQQEDVAVLQRMQLAAPARRENVVLKGSPKRFPPYRLNDEVGIRDYYRSYRKAVGL